MSSAGVYVPYRLVHKSTLPAPPVDSSSVSDDDRRVFVTLDHLMGSRRSWARINGKLISTDGSGAVCPEWDQQEWRQKNYA